MCLSCSCGRPSDDHGDHRHITLADLAAAADAADISPAQAARNIAEAAGGAAKGRSASSGVLLKANDEQRVALYVAYPVAKADVGVAMDRHIDFASREVVAKAAWNWLTKGGRLGLWHEVSTDDFETVESALHHGPDWVVKAVDGTERVIVDGDWLIAVRAKTPEAWRMVKSGQIGGASPQGGARRRRPSPEALASLRR